MKAVPPNPMRNGLWRLTPKRTAALLAYAGAMFAWAPPVEAQPSFQGVGDLPGGITRSLTYGISADGTTAVGFSKPAVGDEAFIWTEETGMIGLGDLPGGNSQSRAYRVSADGSVVVGRGHSDIGFEAFRWTAQTGMIGLGIPGTAYDVSDDGQVVVGMTGGSIFRWTASGGMTILGSGSDSLPPLPCAISGDGSTVVGRFSGGMNFWTIDGGLGSLPGEPPKAALGVSPNGQWIVGYADAPQAGIGLEAIRWQMGVDMLGLGDLPGGDFCSEAYDVSADGKTVVGYGDINSYCTQAGAPEPMVWTEAGGMRSIKEILLGYGLDVEDWVFDYATGVSDDGLTIVGSGGDRSAGQGWIARLAATGDGDFDSDGDVDLGDFREFQNCHDQGLVTAGCVPGDMQGSGFVTLEDFELFYDAQTGPN